MEVAESAGGSSYRLNAISLSMVVHYLLFEAPEKHKVGHLKFQVCYLVVHTSFIFAPGFVARLKDYNYWLPFNFFLFSFVLCH